LDPQQRSTVKVWNVDTQRVVASLSHEGNIYSVDISPDDNVIAMTGSERTFELWAWRDPRRVPVSLPIDNSPDTARGVSTDATGTVSARQDCGALASWIQYRGVRSLFSGVFSPDGSLVAAGGGDCLVRVWDVATGRPIHVLTGHTVEVTRLVFSQDGTYLASASGPQGGGYDSVAWLWNTRTWQGRPLGTNRQDRIYGLAISSDDQFVATTSGDNTARVWTNTGQLWATLTGHAHWVGSAAFDPLDPRILVTTGADDGTARVWDVGREENRWRQLFELHHPNTF
jgi:WD40 repeat protein